MANKIVKADRRNLTIHSIILIAAGVLSIIFGDIIAATMFAILGIFGVLAGNKNNLCLAICQMFFLVLAIPGFPIYCVVRLLLLSSDNRIVEYEWAYITAAGIATGSVIFFLIVGLVFVARLYKKKIDKLENNL